LLPQPRSCSRLSARAGVTGSRRIPGLQVSAAPSLTGSTPCSQARPVRAERMQTAPVTIRYRESPGAAASRTGKPRISSGSSGRNFTGHHADGGSGARPGHAGRSVHAACALTAGSPSGCGACIFREPGTPGQDQIALSHELSCQRRITWVQLKDFQQFFSSRSWS